MKKSYTIVNLSFEHEGRAGFDSVFSDINTKRKRQGLKAITKTKFFESCCAELVRKDELFLEKIGL